MDTKKCFTASTYIDIDNSKAMTVIAYNLSGEASIKAEWLHWSEATKSYSMALFKNPLFDANNTSAKMPLGKFRLTLNSIDPDVCIEVRPCAELC